MYRRAKFDAANLVLGGVIRNRTNTEKQTVTDISTPYLSPCADKNDLRDGDISRLSQMDPSLPFELQYIMERKLLMV